MSAGFRVAAQALARVMIQLSLVHRRKLHAEPPNCTEAVEAILPKLRPNALIAAFPVVAMLMFGVTRIGCGGKDARETEEFLRIWPENDDINDKYPSEWAFLSATQLLLDQEDDSLLVLDLLGKNNDLVIQNLGLHPLMPKFEPIK
jgi:hypothetical protein